MWRVLFALIALIASLALVRGSHCFATAEDRGTWGELTEYGITLTYHTLSYRSNPARDLLYRFLLHLVHRSTKSVALLRVPSASPLRAAAGGG